MRMISHPLLTIPALAGLVSSPAGNASGGAGGGTNRSLGSAHSGACHIRGSADGAAGSVPHCALLGEETVVMPRGLMC